MISSGAIDIAALENAAASITSQPQSANPLINHMPPPATPATRCQGPFLAKLIPRQEKKPSGS